VEIELVLDAHATIGESITWAATEGALYWIDVKAPALYRFDPASGAQRRWGLPSDVGAFALTPGGAVVALREGMSELEFEGGAVTRLAAAPFDPALFRFNEGACDSAGRFWVGVMFDPLDPRETQKEPGLLHSFTRAGGLVRQPDVAELHNGMAWSVDGRLFYLSHSNQQEVFAYAFDVGRGRVGERRRFVQVPERLGLPDGAAVDAEGGYWCALHGGGRLHRYTAEGKLDREVMLPVSQPTMCAFGGAALDVMYVTSASDKLSAEQLRAEPHAGGIFRFRPGVRGLERHCFVG